MSDSAQGDEMKTTIPVGPYHPLIEEPELFRIVVEGERVVDIDWRTSYMHRGIEKIAESKTYDQTVFLVERICGICSTSHPIAFCNAVEDLAGVEIPVRARYIRSLVAELERIHSHLLWLGIFLFLLRLGSKRKIKYKLATEDFLENLNRLSSGYSENVAHHDTVEYFLERLEPEELYVVRQKMVR